MEATPEQIASEVVNKLLDYSLWDKALKVVLVLVVVLLIKYSGESIVGYLKFRMDQNIMKGTRVRYDGETGFVRKVSFFSIIIETEDGWMPVPMKEWGEKKLIKLKDIDCTKCSLNRRKTDNPEL